MHIHPDLALRIARERQEREREIRQHRALVVSEPGIPVRRRLGESLIRLGERLAASPDPAWSR